jgi:hypothetical protein
MVDDCRHKLHVLVGLGPDSKTLVVPQLTDVAVRLQNGPGSGHNAVPVRKKWQFQKIAILRIEISLDNLKLLCH